MWKSEARRAWMLALILAVMLIFAVRSGALQAVLEILSGNNIQMTGAPVPATHSKLSEHEKEYIAGLAPQQQAEELLRAAINHDEGATDMIMGSLDSWRGKLQRTNTFEALARTAFYSNDLRVRAAMIEVDLIAYGLEKTQDSADALIESGLKIPGNRPFDGWVLGMLANRSIEPEHIHEVLRDWTHDANEQTRFYAVEGMAHIGTDDTIADFLDVLRNDPSMSVRERAGCSLAKSGMLTREQRMGAVPGLIEIAADPGVDATTRSWAFQALREITDEPLGNDVSEWRNWFSQHGAERKEHFRREDQNLVRGNS